MKSGILAPPLFVVLSPDRPPPTVRGIVRSGPGGANPVSRTHDPGRSVGESSLSKATLHGRSQRVSAGHRRSGQTNRRRSNRVSSSHPVSVTRTVSLVPASAKPNTFTIEGMWQVMFG